MGEHDQERDGVDEASEESFPASDPPAWEPVHVGAPASRPTVEPKPDSAPRRSDSPEDRPG